MFDAWCGDCGERVLLTTRRIRRLTQDGGAIRVAFVCWRGHDGVWMTGRNPACGSATRSEVWPDEAPISA